MDFIHIIFIDNSIDRCIKYEKIFKKYDNIIFDYESEYNEIGNINFDYYDICFYNINNGFQLELLEKHKTIFIAMDNDFAIPENEQYVKNIMNSGFDIYVSSIMDNTVIKHILTIYKMIIPKKSLL